MSKFFGILAIISSIIFFNSCSDIVLFKQPEIKLNKSDFNNIYGNYLAGKVALLRSDYENSSKYLSRVYEKDENIKELPEQLYMIFSARGDVSKAAEYVRKSGTKNIKNNVPYSILVVDYMVNRNYDSVLGSEDAFGSDFLSFFKHIIIAWAKAGKGDESDAIKELEKFGTANGTDDVFYLYNKAMLYEYFGHIPDAKEVYEKLIEI